MIPLKVAGASAVSVVVLGGGGYLVYDNLIDTYIRTLDTTGYGNDTFGKKYGRYLLDPNSYKNKGRWSKEYDSWRVYKTQSTNSLSSEFQDDTKVDKSYSNSQEERALNRVCEVAFKAQVTEVENSSKSNYDDNVWMFCSLLDAKPVFINQSDAEYSGKLGQVVTYKDKAMSSKKPTGTNDTNASFWDLRNKEFFELGWGSNAANDSIFKTLYDQRGSLTDKENNNVRKKCEEAYKKDTNSPEKDDIKKFCYLIPE
ncbi:hypothetical protein [Candidatus Mycoplasma haematohominis]|uniref:Uncharacterized protein n=1 Tax=Candidatus Mycoplasma haematohominis TaxID=1494318 RepID=A0A478FQC3_9MOLU|nr:hypothetical protein [Candidatus Mycoplasma haemohominis]GCE63512.1 hypothetical protein MHSWG343_05090 [Candidatus Mycoplasma haemohominis]